MKKSSSFLPSGINERVIWLNNFGAKIGNYATKYGITQAEVTDMVNASVYFSFWVNYSNQHAEHNQKTNAWKMELMNGNKEGVATSIPPAAPTFGTIPTAVPTGIFKRVSKLAQVIKNRANYTVADGKDLGIEAVEQVAEKTSSAKPNIKLVVTSNKVTVVWKKGRYQGVVIEVDRGDGFQYLANDTSPNYDDVFPFPKQPTVWKYRAIYTLKDQTVGNWSDTAVVAVGG